MEFEGNFVDIHKRAIFYGKMAVKDGKIDSLKQISEAPKDGARYYIPGLIDAHIHIESSMLVPTEFARAAVTHGVVATVSDPHEIANVMGVEGVEYMIENGRKTPFKFFFGCPSCVPATPFETAGAILGVDETKKLMEMAEVRYMSEMMNFPGVIQGMDFVMDKLKIAKDLNKPIDGHAPMVTGEGLKKYIDAGISTDHECSTIEEAREKLKGGMKILIREGSAAKNFEALNGLLREYPGMVMFCSDDRHPDNLEHGHVNLHVKRALDLGHDLFDVLRAASLNAVEHYGLDVGLLREGDAADFAVLSNLKEFGVLETYIDGKKVAENGKTLLERVTVEPINNFRACKKTAAEFAITATTGKVGEKVKVKVIDSYNGELLTGLNEQEMEIHEGGVLESDISRDILKIAVVNRYEDVKPSLAFIKGFKLKRGAIAQSVAHDSHNIVAVGANDEEICAAVNAVISGKGGLAVSAGKELKFLPLPIAGLMSADDYKAVSRAYSGLDTFAKTLTDGEGVFDAPFMTLSFMALLVIPSLKLSDKGLFNSNNFEFVGLVTA